ncbi:sugar phosphate isomerase/epimerase [Leptolyngbyaceae cyanobacterium CCMR0082]|uniref:Sugar phosphate isomerase/epimerase n=2 Tax=Adonisia turfae TaxID=2950184 RepID=A0A6M0SAI4_9CYAN|nr:TIM barrel protein [Leptothoe sp. LEGE 181152]NEZ58639.1 sugar phosphate isomerase/epimerase [Adonisia turfae CCMR0081]NEZ65518.1 sugar phosphate isomerase/epimerase [Adonisia turfae CCMR0082]
MKLLILRSWWTGPTDLDLLVQQTLNDGFDGIEGPIPQDKQQQQQLRQLLQDNDLVFIAEATTGSDSNDPKDWWIPRPDRSIDDHLGDLKWVIDHAQDMGALFVSTMCGYDAWSWQQNVDFFGRALELEHTSGCIVSFETHRSRSLYNPWTTRDLLKEYPSMKLTCDFSHWCVVCERLIDTEWSILELCAERAQHIQCRVGYPQHAQVSDPRAPEYQEALTAHERWWSLIWEKQRIRGMAQTTMMPEFLYDGYMQTLPYTNMPVADVWEITCWMAQRQRQRFANWQ